MLIRVIHITLGVAIFPVFVCAFSLISYVFVRVFEIGFHFGVLYYFDPSAIPEPTFHVLESISWPNTRSVIYAMSGGIGMIFSSIYLSKSLNVNISRIIFYLLLLASMIFVFFMSYKLISHRFFVHDHTFSHLVPWPERDLLDVLCFVFAQLVGGMLALKWLSARKTPEKD